MVNNKLQLVDILVSRVAPQTSGALLTASGNINLADGQLGLLLDQGTTFVSAATTAAQKLRLLQGTPASANAATVSQYNVPDSVVLRSDIVRQNVRSVTCSAPLHASNAAVSFTVASLGTITVNTVYQVKLILRSARNDQDFGYSEQVITGVFRTGSSAPAATVVFQGLIDSLNSQSKLYNKGNTQLGSANFVCIPYGTGGTAINSLTATTVLNPSANVVLPMNLDLFHTFVNAVAAGLTGTNTVSVTAGAVTTANTLGFVIVGLDEDLAVSFDNIPQVKTNIVGGVTNGTFNTAFTVLNRPMETRNGNRVWRLFSEQRAQLQKFNMQNQPLSNEYFPTVANYIGSDAFLQATLIEHFDTVQGLNNTNLHEKLTIILSPRTLTLPGTGIVSDGVYTFGAVTGLAALNTLLGTASLFPNASYINCAAATPFTPIA